ncbi:hypothetical protein SRHO_G00329290 [Serrasalmus rhombeus]
MGLAEEESPMMERPESVARGCSEDRYSVASGCSEGPFNFKAVEALKRGSSPALCSSSSQSAHSPLKRRQVQKRAATRRRRPTAVMRTTTNMGRAQRTEPLKERQNTLEQTDTC